MIQVNNFLKSEKLDYLVFSFLLLLGIFWFSITFLKYENFSFRSGDTSTAEQAIWNTIHGRFFYQSFLETETNLSEHLNFIQLFYIPFYAIFPHTLTLFFVIQSSFILGALFLYNYVKKKINRFASVIAVGLFIFNPLTASQTVGDMHVVSVSATIFLMLLLAYHEKQYKRFFFWTIVTLLVSEFVAPTVFLVGFLALIERRNWKWFLPPMLGGIGLYLLAKSYITIGFGSHENIISKFSWENVKSINKLNARLELIKRVLAPLLWFLPFFSKYILLLFPSLVIALVVISPGRIASGSHIFILVVPILVVIFIDLVERFFCWRKIIYIIAILGILFSSYWWYKWMEIDRSKLTVEMNRAIEMIKDGGSLTTFGQIGPKVNRREEFFFTFNNKFTDYAILKVDRNKKEDVSVDICDDEESLKYYQKLEKSGLYRIVFEEKNVVVYVKKEKMAQLLGVSIDKINELTEEEVKNEWRNL